MHTIGPSSLVTVSLALGVGACAPSDRGSNPFDSQGGVSDADTGGNGGGTSADSDSDSATGQGQDDGTDGGATSASGSTGDDADDGGAKFDLGSDADLGGGTPTGDGCKYLDMLFVVDISGSMSEEKANLNTNFPDFVQVLDDYVNDPENGALGYRIGVTNSSHQEDGSTTGLDGELDGTGGLGGQDDCGTDGNKWLEGPDPDLATNFPCLANNPTACSGSCSDLGVERPLDSIVGFVDKSAPGGPNDGFYRGEESLLVIVTLTDEDDQSTVSPAGAKAELDTFTQGEERYVIVTVAGPQNSGCESAFGEATAAPRLHEFTNAVPNGLMGDICEGDLTQALQEALALITFSCDTLPPPEG